MGAHWAPASMAKLMRAPLEAVADRHSLVEYEALTSPQTRFLGHCLQVFKDTALQVVHLLHSLLLQECSRLLAADAAGAEHRDSRLPFAAQQPVTHAAKPVGKVAEANRLRVDRTGEGTNRDLVSVTRVDHDRVGIGDERVPISGLHVGSGVHAGIKAWLAHGDDLALNAHLHPVERHGGRTRQLDVEIRAVG